MRIVGHRKERPLTFFASGALLEEGARFNDELHQFPTGNMAFIPKGVFRFKCHEDANRQQQDCLVEGMAQIALERAFNVMRAPPLPQAGEGWGEGIR